MLNFIGYSDTVTIYRASTTLDDWGMITTSEEKEVVKCRLVEEIQTIKISGEKSNSHITKYSICFPHTVKITEDDKVEVRGKVYRIAQLKTSRDLSGNLLMSKVWV